MHSAWVTRASRIASSTRGKSSRSSGESRWQWESTNKLHRMRGPRRREMLAEEPLDRRLRRGARFVERELHADALRAIPLAAVGCDPDDLALHGDSIRIVHQRQQHEHFL